MIQFLANPGRFLSLLRWAVPLAGFCAVVIIPCGLYLAFLGSPPDYQQGETVRIMYIHVPAAWLSLLIYVTMAVAGFVGLVWKHVVAELYVRAAAPLGAAFTFICLATGSLWGKPMWGTWWVWDARLTSMLILFFLYLGYIVLAEAFDDKQKGLNAGACLLLIGLVNIPIIKFSVDWWHTLHQPASVSRLAAPALDPAMLAPLLVMALGLKALFSFFVLLRLKTEIMQRRIDVLELSRL